MISFEEIQKYLPQYLSATSQHILFEELKKFPHNMDQRLYSNYGIEDGTIYQGDGINGLMVINFPGNEIREMPVMVLSNTCDIKPSNVRFFSPRIVYTPIFDLEKYRLMLIEEFVETGQIEVQSINDHIKTIKQQLSTHIIYLPKRPGLENDSIVFLDRLNNYPTEGISIEDIKNKRLFTLSNYGFYLLLVKLSIHFTRVRESIDRSIPQLKIN